MKLTYSRTLNITKIINLIIKYIILVSLGIFFMQCSTLDVYMLMKKGEVNNKNFKVEIPFEYHMGLAVIKVEIDGILYNFAIDTGAPNILSNELFEKLNLKPEFKQMVGDSRGGNKELDFTTIKEIKIGDISFLNTGSIVTDLNANSEMSCLKIDGIIGSNLLKKAIWQFDFENQIITMTNNIEKIKIPDNSEKIFFTTNVIGEPYTDININGILEKEVLLDLGSNGGVAISEKTFQKLEVSNLLTSKITGFGVRSTGIYSSGKNENYYLGITPKITAGSLNISNQIVTTSLVKTIGLQIFKNYKLIFDWNKNEITFIKNTVFRESKLNSYGYRLKLDDNKVFVSLIYKNSSANLEGLKMGDQIISINGEDLSFISQAKWCQLYENRLSGNLPDEINIEVLRKGKKLNFNLKKELLLGKTAHSPL